MRGLPRWRVGVTGNGRYNPAYAGTTNIMKVVVELDTIQPRVCGDYLFVGSHSLMTVDTTPRMRGLPPAAGFMQNLGRYNPAYAGTTVENI